MIGISKLSLLVGAGFVTIFGAPQSTNFTLESYGIGSGGSSESSSTNYESTVISGEQGNQSASGNFGAGSGLIATQQANVPAAPTVDNPSSYYNKLNIVIDDGGNASDATFAIAISPDAFASTTLYVQSDNTISATLGAEDWQTYAAWGGGSGFDVIGLLPDTTYTVKVKAEHGQFTESAYSDTGAAATVNPSLTFDIDVSAADTETAGPYSISFGNLLSGSVVDTSDRIWVDFATNGETGGYVFVASSNTGLNSPTATYTIDSLTGDLAALSEGFGLQNVSATQSSGGPLSILSPYDGGADNVGIADTTLRRVYESAVPITAGRGSVVLKARSASDTPAANDYSDVLTLIAAASF